MGDTVYFIFFVTAYGAVGIGQITKSNFDLWRESGHKLKVLYPKRYNISPMIDERTKKPVGYNVNVTPIQLHKSDQKEIYMDISEIEILGEVEKEGNTLVCKGKSREMFNELYLTAIDHWKTELSGLSIASPEETAALLKKKR